jgi:uncharacterized membrane protein YjdF
MNPFLTIASLTTILFLVITFTAHGPSTYRFAFIFLAPILWAMYRWRDKLAMHPGHFALMAIALLFHNLGAYGLYRTTWAGIEFDGYVHYFFGFAGAFAVARALGYNFELHGWKVWIGTILVILGISAIHELIEFASTIALGPEKGMLKLGDGDVFDTQKDILNALLGTLTALGLYGMKFSPAFLGRGFALNTQHSSVPAPQAAP